MTSADLTAPPPMPEPPGMTEANPYLDLGAMDPHNGKAVLTWYSAEQIAARDAQWSERIASLLRAVPPLPVVAWEAEDASYLTWLEPASPKAGQALVRKADADAAIASLQARLEAAERDRDEFLRALEVIAVGDSADPVRDAGDQLVAMGYWRKEALDGMRAATSQEGK